MLFAPAASAPAAASRASASMCMLHGVSMLQVDAIPTCGFAKSASSKPTARGSGHCQARKEPTFAHVAVVWPSFTAFSSLDLEGYDPARLSLYQIRRKNG